ncbi:putative NAD dependent epimerase/dehydratase [Saccharata proteae CBS 121410]|uniref:NAD dependent epimerase/dehydratase n=1 Tax=Saccharata proteae CBS 121410 TaxID=1314787 RepID=A0A9P4HZP0_9PEZI|nr:putative NAD dependent epimerase/dehydratase [Saccharata proteae CBS 121410]
MSNQHVLITGGTGFLGSAIVDALLEHHPEFRYTVLDLKPATSWTPPRPGISYIEADITDFEALDQELKRARPTVIVHTAGVVPAGTSRYNQKGRDAVFRVNVDGTKHMLEAAQRCGVSVFVYTSSCTVITDDVDRDYPNMDEATPTGNASLKYGQSKAAAEALVLAANKPSFQTCTLRPSMLFGPGDANLLPPVHALIGSRATAFILGPGTNLYDFTYVANAADAHVLAVDNLLATGTAAGEAFFITNDAPVPFRAFCVAVWSRFGHVPGFELAVPTAAARVLGTVADVVGRVAGVESALGAGSVKDAVGVRYASIEKARRVLGYEPRVELDEGVRLACEDFKRRMMLKETGF